MPDPITLAALRAYITLSDPHLSPNGARVAYVRSGRDYVNDRNVASIVVVNSDGSVRRVIDSGPFVSSPRWSPDGTQVAFLRHTVKNDADQIIVVRLASGTERTVTSAPNGVEHFAWSPDSSRFAYVTPNDEPNAAAAKHSDDLFDVGDVGMLTRKPTVSSHLWLVAANGGTAKRLTHGTWSVYEGVAPFVGGPSDPSWSHDGRTILIDRAPDAQDAVSDRSAPALVDVATGNVHDLGTTRQYAYFPSFAPSGDRYAYVRPHGPGPISSLNVIVASLHGGEVNRTASLDRDVTSIRWAGSSIVATAPDHVENAVYAIPASGAARKIDTAALSVGDTDADANGDIVFNASRYGFPPEIYVVKHGGAPHMITNENVALRNYAYGRAERISWTAADGEKSEGILVHPIGERAGKKYPLLIWSHGGPEEAMTLGYDEVYGNGYGAGLLAASRGWFAFIPDYRGSDDAGTAHEHAIYRDPGNGPMTDIMAGLASVEAHEPIDTSRECVGGHSYGGFMTAWMIGHETRWRCAIIADGAVDWRAAYDLSGTGNMSWARDSLGGSPWSGSAAQLYRDGSPITYVDAVKTPTMIITGLDDDQVPYTESWEFYHALRDRGVPVRLVGIPTAHHTPSDPVRLEAYYRTMWAWLAQYLR